MVSAMNASCCGRVHTGLQKEVSYCLCSSQTFLAIRAEIDTLARLPAFNSFIPSKYSSLEQVWIAKGWKEENYLFLMAVSLLQVQLGVKLPQKLRERLAFY